MSKDLTFRKKLNSGKDDNWDEFTEAIVEVTINEIHVCKETGYEKIIKVPGVWDDYDAEKIIDECKKYGWRLINSAPKRQRKIKINYAFMGHRKNRRRLQRRPRF